MSFKKVKLFQHVFGSGYWGKKSLKSWNVGQLFKILYSESNYTIHRLRIYHVTSGIVNIKLKYMYKPVIYFYLILIETLCEPTSSKKLREKIPTIS